MFVVLFLFLIIEGNDKTKGLHYDVAKQIWTKEREEERAKRERWELPVVLEDRKIEKGMERKRRN